MTTQRVRTEPHARDVRTGGAHVGPVAVGWTDAAPDGPHPPTVIGTPDLGALGLAQRRRYEALEGMRAHRFALGRMMVATLIRAVAGPGADTRVDTRCARCGGAHGAPRAVGAPVLISVSYSGSVVVVAVAPQTVVAALGVDVERRQGRGDVRTDLAPLFAPGSPPDVAGWTRIEAVLKADGRGVQADPAGVVRDTGVAASARLVGGSWMRAPAADRAFEVVTRTGSDAPEGCVLSLAVGWA